MTNFSSTDLALRAFELRPSRAETLADLSRTARDKGANESAAMFAKRGLAIPPSDDLLFVETWAHESLLEDLMISGYYSCDPETREDAHRITEETAISRSVSPYMRARARDILFWYAPKLVMLAPSWQAKQIEGFTAPENWHAMNPSVVRFGDKVLINVRCVNYWINPDGSYQFPHTEPAVMTRNFLAEVDPSEPHRVVSSAVEIIPDLGWMEWGDVRGMEDVRLFTRGGQLWFSATCRQMNTQGLAQQLLGRLSLDGTVHELRPMPLNTGRYEKNWLAIIGLDEESPPKFVYRCDPMTIVSADQVDYVDGTAAEIGVIDNFAGSTPLIPVDEGWLAMIHEPLSSPINGRRLNQQRFVLFDKRVEPCAMSRRFIFSLNEEIEYPMAIIPHPNEKQFIISYGSHDREAWVGTIDIGDVYKMLSIRRKEVAPVTASETNSFRGYPRPAPTPEPEPEPNWDALSLNRSLSPEKREQARCELHKHLAFVHEIFPSWASHRLMFETPENFVAHAPCMVNHKGRMLASVRCMNYSPGNESEYYRISDGAMMGNDVVPVSRTFMLEIDPETLKERVLGELVMPPYLKTIRKDARSYGFEDTRLFEWGGDLWGIAAFFERSADNLAEQWVFRIDLDTLQVSDARYVPLHGKTRRSEKNWVPIIDGGPEPRFLYMSAPSTVVDAWGHIVSEKVPDIAAEHFHNGSQLVPFDGGWLSVVRWMQILNPANRWIEYEYRNRFAWFDGEFCLQRVSPPWQFPVEPSVPSFPRRFQIVQGLAWHPDNQTLIVGYELHDNGNSFVAKVSATDVRKAFGFHPEAGNDDRWVSAYTNRALQDSAAVEHATNALREANLPEHKGPYKNWDTWLAISHARRLCMPFHPILDAGGHADSAFLPGMKRLDFHNLLNLNIDEQRPRDEGGICWRRGDITSSGLPDFSQRFVLCQSVLEDLPDWRKFFSEMARIIGHGGHLFVSTDYWENPITTSAKIFTPEEVREMVAYADGLGLKVTNPVDYTCRDACVEWVGLRYTFICLLFHRS